MWGLAALLTASVVAYLVFTGDGESKTATPGSPGNQPPLSLETADSGLIARLPFVGTLRWNCLGGRFETYLYPPQATVFVSLTADGRHVFRRRRVDPSPNPDTRIIVGTPKPARRTQTWTVTYNHKPATIRVTARLRFRASNFNCRVAHTEISAQRTR
jgi:hypothetical protein